MHRVMKGGLQVLAVLLSPLLILLALVVKLVSTPFEKPISRSREEVAAILERRVSASPDWAEWDAFTCIQIADAQLEAIRRECVALEGREPRGDAPSFVGVEAAARYHVLASGLRDA